MGIKIVSDFDGVWTDQALEAEHVRLYLVAEAARCAGLGDGEAARDFASFERCVRAEPARHGWAPEGRITAFVDEDPFCVPNAIAAHLEVSDDPRARLYREALLDAGEPSLAAFSDRCFLTATADFRAQHPPGLVRDAARTVGLLRELGAQLVVVSNSPSEKLLAWFQAAGVEASPQPGAALRVLGTAGKQVLGAGEDCLELGGRRVLVDRPRYRAILEAEEPDLVVGDVFSLDLALPAALRAAGGRGAPGRIVLRRHAHTPAWTLGLHHAGWIDRVVGDVLELVPEVAELAL